jgi:hypothetical protein
MADKKTTRPGDGNDEAKKYLIEMDSMDMGDDSAIDQIEDTESKDPVVQDLGTVEEYNNPEEPTKPTDDESGPSLGYKQMSLAALPTKGMFYSTEAIIEFRPATTGEVKKYSGVDEENPLSVLSAIKTLLASCIKIHDGGKIKDGMHLIDADKIFMIFAIRDLTMTDRGQERKMMVDYDCPHCGHVNKKDISHYDFGFLKIPEELMKWYDDKERCFVINHTLFQGKPIYAAPPSIGLTSKVIDYIQSKQSSNVLDQQADAMEIDMLQFIRVKDFRSYDKDIIQGKIREFGTWPEAKYQAMVALIRRLTKSTNPTYNIKCGDNTLKGCDREFDAPIRFRFADIFDLSNIVEELF